MGVGVRQIVTRVLGVVLLFYATIIALGVASESGWFHGPLPPDTQPQNESQAEDVAFSVASNAGCGSFDSEQPHSAADTWRFDCIIGSVPYTIFVYGSDQARSLGTAGLQADGRPFVAKAYYAVTAIRSGVGKVEALTATAPPMSVMDPFR